MLLSVRFRQNINKQHPKNISPRTKHSTLGRQTTTLDYLSCWSWHSFLTVSTEVCFHGYTFLYFLKCNVSRQCISQNWNSRLLFQLVWVIVKKKETHALVRRIVLMDIIQLLAMSVKMLNSVFFVLQPETSKYYFIASVNPILYISLLDIS